MKLVLASQGFMTDEIADNISKLINKPLKDINVAIINEAYITSSNDKRWLINEISFITKYVGGIVSFVNLRAHDIATLKERLEFADIIYIVGGAQFVLPNLFKETGFDVLLKELAEEKVIMGTSAGSMVLGKQIISEQYWLKRYNKLPDEKLLEFVDFNIIPHYLRADRSEYDEQYYSTVLSDNSFPVYAINDNQAIIYDNGNILFVGGNPVLFGKKD